MVATKSGIDKKHALALVNSFMHEFQNCFNRPAVPSAVEFEKFLSRNFQITTNGHTRAKSLAEYLARIQKLQQKYAHVELSSPIHDPVIADNKVVIEFKGEFTPRAGKKTYLYFMAIGTVEDNKWVQWEEVTHSKDEAQWDN